MKVKVCVLSALVIGLFFSAGTDKANPTVGCRPGDRAAEIACEGNNPAIRFADSDGYTLVNFWATYDAPSRVNNIRMQQAVAAIDSSDISFYAISMDEKRSVYEEALAADRMPTSNQLFDGRGSDSPIFEQYGLKKGFRNFLIDRNGIIVAVDLTPETLREWIAQAK